ncbi:hypothetical protein [Sphingomonas sp.]|uniref:hypothetical protein n=1 Tax=Sphingomonas sp. TaxID=28214 RepID=UPI00181ED99D|nr:hypothetical protein [Sphingomonas sp.]MBA4760721.1 hypothetical protein [Sphingomonas sp.]
MRILLDFGSVEFFNVPPGADNHPVAALAAIEREKGRGIAMRGLRMAINDLVEMTADMSSDAVARFDAKVAAAGGMALSEARALFSKRLKAVLKRSQIADEREYYLVRNAVEFVAEEAKAALWDLLAQFEAKHAEAPSGRS